MATPTVTCSTCGFKGQMPQSLRCPRCNVLLISPCNGNCGQCREKKCG